MKLDTLGSDKPTVELDIGGKNVAFARVKLEAVLQADFEYSIERREEAIGVRRITQHIVQPDEHIEERNSDSMVD